MAYDRESLRSMSLGRLRVVAKECGISSKGKKAPSLIEEILASGASPIAKKAARPKTVGFSFRDEIRRLQVAVAVQAIDWAEVKARTDRMWAACTDGMGLVKNPLHSTPRKDDGLVVTPSGFVYDGSPSYGNEPAETAVTRKGGRSIVVKPPTLYEKIKPSLQTPYSWKPPLVKELAAMSGDQLREVARKIANSPVIGTDVTGVALKVDDGATDGQVFDAIMKYLEAFGDLQPTEEISNEGVKEEDPVDAKPPAFVKVGARVRVSVAEVYGDDDSMSDYVTKTAVVKSIDGARGQCVLSLDDGREGVAEWEELEPA